MEQRIIRFGDDLPDLSDYGNIPWNLNEQYSVEFYPHFFITVLLISTENPLLQKHLDDISNGIEPISLDLEWEDEICLLQFCTSKGCLIIRHPQGPGNLIIRAFLENHSFYGKGNHNDIQKLHLKFGIDLKIDLEDIEQTRLIPNGYSTNFIKMSEQFAGKSTAVFKDKEMTFSDWEIETLSMRQVFYAAFDVVALFKCYPNFPPPSSSPQTINIKKKGPKGKKSINVDSALRRKYPLVNPDSIDLSRPIYLYILRNYKEVPNVYEIKNKISMICDVDFDFVSIVKNCDSVDVILSLFSEIEKKKLDSNLLLCDNIDVVNDVDPFCAGLFTKDDVFFLYDIPDSLLNHDSLNDFLFIFGFDFQFNLFENEKYAVIKPNDPYASLRINKLLPLISNISIHEFPSFIPTLTVFIDSNANILSSLGITEGQQESIEIKLVSQTSQKSKYSVTFTSNIEKEEFFEKFILCDKNTNEISVFPFTTDDHYGYIQSYKIILKNCNASISSIYKIFSKFGPIFSIQKEDILNYIYVQFRAKSDAYRSISQLKKEKQSLFSDIEILKGSFLTLRNLPDDITKIEVIDACKETGEILEIEINERHYIKITLANNLQVEDTRDTLKGTVIRGNEIQVEMHHKKQVGTPSWKIKQINKWVKIKHEIDIFTKASKFGTVVDMKMKDDEQLVFIMFSNEQSADKMKKQIKECEDCDQQTFTLFLNKHLLAIENKEEEEKMEDKSSSNIQRYYNRKVFILDPKPEKLTDEIIAEKAFAWRHLISGAHNVDSIAHKGKKRSIFYSGGKKRDQQIIDLIINLGIELNDENRWKPVALTYSRANKVFGVPPPPVKKARRWVIIDPVPISMTEDVIRDICAEFEPFDVIFQNSSIQRGEKRAVVLKEPHAKFVYWKLVGMEFEGKQLNVIKIAPEFAPLCLD